MAAAAELLDKTDEQRAITEMVRQFVDEQIIPNAEHYDHEDSFPEPIVEQMKELGLFGVTLPEEYGGMGLDLTTYAMIVEELSRGWISISGVVNTHFIGSYLLMKFGTDEQKESFLPRMATGELRAAFSLSEPECGSDVQGIKSVAKKLDDGDWELNGQKMWVTNGLMSGVVFVLMKDDPKADPPYKGMTCFITEKEPGAPETDGHQAIQFKLADMATKVEAARLLTMKAARLKDAGERSDLEAGMAKLFASETGKEVVEEAFRIHGGYGYSKEYEIERLYRDAPLLLIGEGTSEIQRMVIGKKLLERHKL